MPEPFISVVIIAHDRKQFIKRAVDSALHQTLNRKHYEIIVVKYFKDSRIDGYLKQRGVRNIYTKEIPMGTKFSIGIKASRGKVIAFLEDDDYFHKRKLTKIYDSFGNPNVCYYHNAMLHVDGSGRGMNLPEPRNAGRSGTLPSDFVDLMKYDASVMGCIAVRATIAKRHADEIRGIKTNLEAFMFYAMRTQTSLLFFDSERLTYHTVQRGSLGIPTYNSFEEFCSKRTSFFEAQLDAFNRTAKVVGKAALERGAGYEILYTKEMINLVSDRDVYGLRAGDYAALLVHSLPTFLMAVSHSMFPGFTARMYYKAKMATAYRRLR